MRGLRVQFSHRHCGNALMYEQRFLLYVDILGWTTAVKEGGGNPRLLKAVERIHIHAEEHNERHRQDIRDRAAKEGHQLFPMFFEVQFGAFSDHFVYSMPVEFGPRIVTTASKLVVDLLRMGWLTRGAIVLGPLYHRDNVIFGPALLEAVDIEAHHSIYPRILISDAALKEFDEWESDPRYKDMIKDQFGRVVVNPFALPFEVTDESMRKAMMDSFVNMNFGFHEIKPLLAAEVEKHTKADRGPQAEKWAYLQRFITERVFSDDPILAEYW
jgi:hypothetical protein